MSGSISICPFLFEGELVDCSTSGGEGEGEGEGEVALIRELALMLLDEFLSLDINGDGRLSFIEVNLSDIQVSRYVFIRIDTNGDGLVSATELRDATVAEGEGEREGEGCNLTITGTLEKVHHRLSDVFVLGVSLLSFFA